MTHPIPATAAAQFRGLFLSLVLDPELLFGRVLSTDAVSQAIADEAGPTGDRVFTPEATLATFLSQVLSDDHSCRAAVARLKGWRAGRGLPPCSLATGGYCKARQRLPEALLPRLVRRTGDGLQGHAPNGWLFHGRKVVIVAYPGVQVLDVAGPAEVFRAASLLAGGAYDVTVAAPCSAMIAQADSITVRPSAIWA